MSNFGQGFDSGYFLRASELLAFHWAQHRCGCVLCASGVGCGRYLGPRLMNNSTVDRLPAHPSPFNASAGHDNNVSFGPLLEAPQQMQVLEPNQPLQPSIPQPATFPVRFLLPSTGARLLLLLPSHSRFPIPSPTIIPV